jgi:hypothetical protein
MDISHIALFFHLLTLIIGFGSVIVIDLAGLLFLLKKRGVTLEKVVELTNLTQPLIWFGWFGLVISGLVMKSQHPGYDELTKFKLFLVATLGLNGIYLHYIKQSLKKLSDSQRFQALLPKIMVATFVSQVGWWGSVIIGFAHAHFSHRILWPSSAVPFVIGLSVLYIALVASVELIKRKK